LLANRQKHVEVLEHALREANALHKRKVTEQHGVIESLRTKLKLAERLFEDLYNGGTQLTDIVTTISSSPSLSSLSLDSQKSGSSPSPKADVGPQVTSLAPNAAKAIQNTAQKLATVIPDSKVSSATATAQGIKSSSAAAKGPAVNGPLPRASLQTSVAKKDSLDEDIDKLIEKEMNAPKQKAAAITAKR